MSKTARAERIEPKERRHGNVIPFARALHEAIEAGLWHVDAMYLLRYCGVEDWQRGPVVLKDMRRLLQELVDAEQLVDLGDQGGQVLVYWCGHALGYFLCGYARVESARQLEHVLKQRGWATVITDTNPRRLWDEWPRPVYERCVPRACRKPKPAAPVDVYEYLHEDNIAPLPVPEDELDEAVGE
jgi:hypothetical protein